VNATPAEACTYYLQVFENEHGTSNGPGDSRTWCKDTVIFAGINDLNAYSHSQEGTCNSASAWRLGDDWDDCIGSVRFYLPTDKCFVMFNDPNGTGAVVKSRRGTNTNYTISNMSQAGNDKTTSFYFGNTLPEYTPDRCKISPAAPANVANDTFNMPYDQKSKSLSGSTTAFVCGSASSVG
jgi:hypothetical protein